MTDDQHGEGAPQGAGRWDPLPHGDYDDGATAFVKLPEGGVDALLASSDTPLAARGHGYVPPQLAAAPEGTDPAAAGTWAAPAEGTQWPDPNAVPQGAGNDRFTYQPGATQQWNFSETSAPQEPAPAPGHDVTGEWSIPVAGGDLPDESGEFTTSSLVEQWGGGTPPATLPGGAPAPWATQAPGQPWGQQAEALHAPEQGGTHGGEQAPAQDRSGPDGHAHVTPGQEAQAHAHVPAPRAEAVAEPYAESPPEPSAGPAPEAVQPAPATDGAPEDALDAPAPAEAAETPAEPPTEPAPDAPEADAEAEPESAPDPGPEATEEQPAAYPGEEHPLASYVLRVNGVDRPVTDAWIGESLLYVLRERLGLAGAKDGCSQGECGACNVQVDGRLVASCLVPAVTAAGSEVRTVEGLAVDGQPSDVQRALARCGAVQCGFCVPGMAMTVHDLLEGNPAPTELETRQALCGNLCRCSGYRGVVAAVQEVVAEREAHAAGDEAEQDGDEARIPHQAGPGAGGVNPSAFEAPGAMDPPRSHDQVYGQDGGQA
ncbi:2Fe-2S iron-sulfur cluster-binding protein [Streptomyces dysideae]|uniref:(2Fe-2S)-binding protein n=1 Tax=Streptomyces dysideae TaxID=909626 RepID=A0A101UWV0_9ACTN|nr:(2Fe-2S)-binding protein [Streptomyces dysideae]KUO18354.1 (2Fe-2S)-binding protein [Streptomyces dysideae]